uniref:G-protein coupled receptors family 1 profile domain-containing protein n=1 Tax=Romanomermis culicivorax TaxID=13658 RepID=A0A915HFR9_ROMCU
MEPDFEYYYTIYLFTVGFCIPSLVTVLCYLFVLIKLYYHTLSSVICRLPLKRVTLTTLALVLLYLICWTPYWTGIVYLITKNESELTVNAIYAVQLTHVLVYLNSALNWIPYTLYCRRYNNNNTRRSSAAIQNSSRTNSQFQLNLVTPKSPFQKFNKRRNEKNFIISQVEKTNI